MDGLYLHRLWHLQCSFDGCLTNSNNGVIPLRGTGERTKRSAPPERNTKSSTATKLHAKGSRPPNLMAVTMCFPLIYRWMVRKSNEHKGLHLSSGTGELHKAVGPPNSAQQKMPAQQKRPPTPAQNRQHNNKTRQKQTKQSHQHNKSPAQQKH